MNSSRDIVSPPPIDEHDSSSGSDELGRRPRLRSRSPVKKRLHDAAVAQKTSRNKKDLSLPNGTSNGHLSPPTATSNKDYWRSLSRSPSPLGLIPIHQEWRSFIHRHEIPRKILHTSIGFLTLGLYASYAQPSQIHPVLLALFIPIFTTDIIRHRYPSFNRFYIRCLGALMRESEVDGWNGVIWEEVGQVHPASVITAVAFYGWIAPKVESLNPTIDSGDFAFAFQGQLSLPTAIKGSLGLGEEQGVISGNLALGVMSFVAGVVASVSEAIDLFGWDDNVTIPILCAGGLWGFLKVFGYA
ncbi:putative phosphatidate cytidylyltransferase protein [Neofusicoccum parvum UCRNP2]|uniref:Putative phosphatidate cytidylyltransferase protein n=1 Tax=Botryosphaeria parva (strain UCR-NP2) TaxID=1287680 RepID=R1G3U0_BOTPV|nr:putative phosphatidate cytidylyltransferase protein [Neofusicoccum parvum UCRNP2]